MRVLNTYNGQFVEIHPRDPSTKYAILSHTWDPKGEQTLQELRNIQKQHISSEHLEPLPNLPQAGGSQLTTPSPSLFTDPADSTSLENPDLSQQFYDESIWANPELAPKIREACRVARENGYCYLWIDSCCIDKTSSSELSESINSMYQWYANANVCYAFLAEVPAAKAISSQEESRDLVEWSYFQRSRWFWRGWTLQELIAPMDVVFLAEDWTNIGTKHDLADMIVEITNIDYNALLHVQPLEDFSIAQRFSWAAERETTRIEDRAYSLLGIFDINLPTLYGEGERAFRRLQEELMRRSPDQSLFAWTLEGLPAPSSNLHDPETAYAKNNTRRFHFDMPYLESSAFLAPSLNFFRKCAAIEALTHNEVASRLQLPNNELPTTNYDFTPYGIRVQLPTISFVRSKYFPTECMQSSQMTTHLPLFRWCLVILQCAHRDFPGHLLARVCYTQISESNIALLYPGRIRILWSRFDLVPVSPITIARLRSESHISSKILYIPQPRREESSIEEAVRQRPHKTFNLLLPKKTREALLTQGYTAIVQIRHHSIRSNTPLVILSRQDRTHTITIDYRHTFKNSSDWWLRGDELTVQASVTVSGPPSSVGTASGSNVAIPAGANEVVHDTKTVNPKWTDNPSWRQELGLRTVKLNIPGRATSTVQLGLSFATTNYYFLHIQVETSHPPTPTSHDHEDYEV